MDTDEQTQTAAEIVNSYDEKDIADLIYQNGEERHSRRVAKKIVEARKENPIKTTAQLAEIVRSAVPKSKDKIDPATRTFQALRIAVNDEFGELDRALSSLEKILKPGGRAIIVSFHSLEDGRVKTFLRARSGESPRVSRHLPEQSSTKAVFRLIHRKALKPTKEEINQNPRARSARLRAAIKTEAA